MLKCPSAHMPNCSNKMHKMCKMLKCSSAQRLLQIKVQHSLSAQLIHSNANKATQTGKSKNAKKKHTQKRYETATLEYSKNAKHGQTNENEPKALFKEQRVELCRIQLGLAHFWSILFLQFSNHFTEVDVGASLPG